MAPGCYRAAGRLVPGFAGRAAALRPVLGFAGRAAALRPVLGLAGRAGAGRTCDWPGRQQAGVQQKNRRARNFALSPSGFALPLRTIAVVTSSPFALRVAWLHLAPSASPPLPSACSALAEKTKSGAPLSRPTHGLATAAACFGSCSKLNRIRPLRCAAPAAHSAVATMVATAQPPPALH